MEFGDYIGANLDVSHYNQTDADAVAFIKQRDRWQRITNVRIKDSANQPELDTVSNTLTSWGSGNVYRSSRCCSRMRSGDNIGSR